MIINTVDGVKALLSLHRGVPSQKEKDNVRKAWKNEVSLTAKTEFRDHFLTLEREEQMQLQQIWRLF